MCVNYHVIVSVSPNFEDPVDLRPDVGVRCRAHVALPSLPGSGDVLTAHRTVPYAFEGRWIGLDRLAGREPGVDLESAVASLWNALRRLLVVAVALCWNGCTRATVPPVEGPSILVVLIDTLRYDALGVNGGTPGYSPTLDSLAAEGFLSSSISTPWSPTCPTGLIRSQIRRPRGRQGCSGPRSSAASCSPPPAYPTTCARTSATDNAIVLVTSDHGEEH